MDPDRQTIPDARAVYHERGRFRAAESSGESRVARGAARYDSAMRSYAPHLLALAAGLFVLPALAHAGGIPYFGPIVPEQLSSVGNTQTCPLSWSALVVVMNNIISFAITMAIVVVAPLSIAYAGFLMVVNPTALGDISKAKNILTNTVIGIVIALAAWLIVDAVFAALTPNGQAFGKKWYELVSGGSVDPCLNVAGSLSQSPATSGIQSTQEPGSGAPDSRFSFQPGIDKQWPTASTPLKALLGCMADKVPANVGVISSISDSAVVDGEKTFEQCAAGGKAAGCAHTVHSYHYGGRSCVGQSYAVDFGDEQHATVLKQAAAACNASYIGFEGDHLHVSVGEASGCGYN